MRALLGLLFACIFLSVFAEDIRDSSTGPTFPKEVSFTQNGKEYQLQATGVATRKKFIVKVYTVAHYMQPGTKEQILQDGLAKQLSIKWVHEAPAAKIVEGYRESFKNVFSDSEAAQLRNEIDSYIQLFRQDLRKGDEQTLRWLPGGNLEVLLNGKSVGHITSVPFVKGLWSIWFGPKSVVDRNKMTSLMR